MQNKLGFIGCGNMANAILGGIIQHKLAGCEDIMVYDVSAAAMQAAQSKYHIQLAEDIDSLIAQCDIVFLCVKPGVVPTVLSQVKVPDKAFVSIAAGVGYETLTKALSVPARFLRIMPNTPLMVGQGMSVFAQPWTLTDSEFALVQKIFETLGNTLQLEEKFLHAVTGISGSGPAYCYLFLEAMANAGVKNGLSFADSLQLAAQTMIGSAQMVQQLGQHPAALKDNVCSPAGTTIDAVASLEQSGFRSSIIQAVDICVEKSKRLS